MSGIQQFLGLSSFKKKEAPQVVCDDSVGQDEKSLVVFKDDNESVMIDEQDPRKKNIPIDLMMTRYAYLSGNQFDSYYHSGNFFTFQIKNMEIPFRRIPFETIKIKDTSEVKDVLFRREHNGCHYFRFIRDKDTHNILMILYAQDKVDKDKIIVGTVVQMDLKSFGIDDIKKGRGRMDEVLSYVIKNMTDYYISISQEEEVIVFRELCLFLGLSMEFEI